MDFNSEKNHGVSRPDSVVKSFYLTFSIIYSKLFIISVFLQLQNRLL